MLPLLLALAWLASPAVPQDLPTEGSWLTEGFELSIWDVQRGLPQRSARSIAQTPDGVIWIGTFDGLARLSSRGVEVLRSPVPGAHTDNAFVSLLVDRKERLWAGTANDILCLERGTWYAFGAERGCAFGVVYALEEDAEGRILASTSRGLAVLEDGRFEELALPPEFAANPEHPRLTRDRSGRLWAQGRRALAFLSGGEWSVVTRRVGRDGALGLALARAGGVWALEDRQLVRREGRDVRERLELPPELEPGDAALCEDRQGNLWVGTYDRGLARRAPDGRWSIAGEGSGLPCSLIPALFLDRHDNLWVGTSGAGAVRLGVPHFRRLHDTSPRVDDNVIAALGQAPAGALHFATHSGGLYRLEGMAETERLHGTGKEVVTALSPDRDEGFWIGTEWSGLWHFDGQATQCLRAVPATFGPISALRLDAEGRLWIGGRDKVGVLDQGELELQSLAGTQVFGFALDGAGRVWAATSSGAYCTSATGVLERRVEVAGERAVRSVLADGAARLWFSLEEPLLVRLEGNARRTYGPQEGFHLEEASLLFADPVGVWLANRDRLIRIPSALECNAPVSFGRGDGIVLGLERPSGRLDAAGRAWVTTTRGLLSFEPEDVLTNRPGPTPRIHSLSLGGRELRPVTGSVSLPATQREFVVRLEAAPAPLQVETRWQYRILPDGQWSDCGDRVAFSRLPPGSTPLEVRAAYGSGPWSDPAFLEVEIEPHVWERTSIRLALASGAMLALLALGLGLHRRRTRTLARRTREATLLAQERARASETLRLVTEAVPAQLVYVAPDRSILWCNRRFREAWGLDGGVLGKPWDVALNSAAKLLTPRLERALRDESVQESISPQAGLELDVAFVPQRDADGTLLGVIGLLIDTTERHALESRLRQALRLEALGTFAGGIAHDFNNLLAVILGRTELALLETEDARATKAHLEEVLLSGLRARDLVARILTFGRRGPGTVEPCDVAVAAAETLRRLRASVPDGVTLRTELESESWARLDQTQVQQLVSNLVSNGILALEGGPGTVEVVVQRRPDGDIELRVRDDGCGIPPELQARIFEPFFSTRATGSGTGLGLSVVHGILRECGGSIEVESSPGQGTTFRLRLPAVTRREDEPQRTVTPAHAPREALLAQ